MQAHPAVGFGAIQLGHPAGFGVLLVDLGGFSVLPQPQVAPVWGDGQILCPLPAPRCRGGGQAPFWVDFPGCGGPRAANPHPAQQRMGMPRGDGAAFPLGVVGPRGPGRNGTELEAGVGHGPEGRVGPSGDPRGGSGGHIWPRGGGGRKQSAGSDPTFGDGGGGMRRCQMLCSCLPRFLSPRALQEGPPQRGSPPTPLPQPLSSLAKPS